MRFLGSWVGSLVALGLVTGLILGREAPPRSYELAGIAEAFQPRYEAALAELEAGGVLYLRSELRGAPDHDSDLLSVSVLETWVGMSGDVPVSRTQWSDTDGTLLRVSEIEGVTQTLLIDHTTGVVSRVPTTVEPVQPPTDLLTQLRQRTLGSVPDAVVVEAEPIAGLEAARVPGSELATSRTSFAVSDPLIMLQQGLDRVGEQVRVRSELALLEWTVLPAGSDLGARPD